LISWTQSGPAGGLAPRVGMHGGMNPLGGAFGRGMWQI
jgi:hypothetical protein